MGGPVFLENSRMRSHQGLAALAICAALAAAPARAEDGAQKSATISSDGQSDAVLVQQGKTIYSHRCSHCHGFNMVNSGSIAYDLRQFPHNDKPRFVRSVTEGKNGRMPQWGDLLKPQEIDEIWAYVMTGGAH